MKKLILLFFIATSAYSSHAQNWVDLGLKGGYGLNFLFNQNAFDDRSIVYNFSYGYSYGGKVGWNFNEGNALTVDIMSSMFNQSFNYNYLNTDSTYSGYTRNLDFNSLDFLLLYRRTKEESYFEIGPQYTLLTNAGLSDTYNGSSYNDVSSDLVESYYAAVMGFGSYMAGGDNFGITVGFRFSYALNDIIVTDGFPYNKSYPTYKSTNPFTALLVMEFNYDLGYIAKAKCKKRSKFLMF